MRPGPEAVQLRFCKAGFLTKVTACVASRRSFRKERAEKRSGATVEARDAAGNAAGCMDGGVGAAAGGRLDATRRAALSGRQA